VGWCVAAMFEIELELNLLMEPELAPCGWRRPHRRPTTIVGSIGNLVSLDGLSLLGPLDGLITRTTLPSSINLKEIKGKRLNGREVGSQSYPLHPIIVVGCQCGAASTTRILYRLQRPTENHSLELTWLPPGHHYPLAANVLCQASPLLPPHIDMKKVLCIMHESVHHHYMTCGLQHNIHAITTYKTNIN
jgi:hypothetical protein